jgi:hypothetical protein
MYLAPNRRPYIGYSILGGAQGPEKHEKRKKAEIREARIESKGMKSALIHSDHIDVHDMNAGMFMS